MKTQTITGLDPGAWYDVLPPERARHVQIVTDVPLLFKARAADATITLVAGGDNKFEEYFTPGVIAFHLKPLSGSPEPGLIWS